MRGQFRRVLGTLTLVLAAVWLTTADVRAESSYQVEDAKLDSFVDAYQAVHKAATEAQVELGTVKTEAQADALRAKFEAAIEDTDGITLAEFREIEEAAIEDEELGKRIIEKMQASIHAQ